MNFGCAIIGYFCKMNEMEWPKENTRFFAELKDAWGNVMLALRRRYRKPNGALADKKTVVAYLMGIDPSDPESDNKLRSLQTRYYKFKMSQFQLIERAAVLLGENEPFWISKYYELDAKASFMPPETNAEAIDRIVDQLRHLRERV